MQLINKYFTQLSTEQHDCFAKMFELYAYWNERINVISRKDLDNLYERHVLHSLAIARVIDFLPGTTVLDVGTGGGFPGIPLAVLFPECRFHMVDSIGKKVKVVRAVYESLGLLNCSCEQIRIEDYPMKHDFVVSRAVTLLPKFIGWVSKNISPDCRNTLPNGILYLKGGVLDEEMECCRQPYQFFQISSFFEEAFFDSKSVVHIAF